MSISDLFIRRPVATTLLMLALVTFGIVGFLSLPVSDLPSVEFPTLQVSASLPGASPETMASSVATPLERQFSTIAGVSSMTSTSTLGNTQIVLQFDLSRSIDAASLDVQAAIARAAPFLPPDLPTPPSFQKVNPADQPILYLSLSSPTLPLADVDEYAETTIAQRVSMVSGVAQVQVFGAQKYAVRVELDPGELASRNLGIDDIQTAIQGSNVNLPSGVIQGGNRAFTVQSRGQLERAEEYRSLVVAYRDDSPVRLADLGSVNDGVENDQIASWYNDTRAIVLAIQKQPGENTVAVVDAIMRLMPEIRRAIPASVALDVLYDRSQSIRASVRDVELTLLLTIGLVVLVIFVFLRSLSATVIAALALPVSIIGTFAAMWAKGYSLDNLSLMALTLSVGFVVDDAIVVLENIVRHVEMGKTPMQAALDGSREIGFTVVSMTLSLAAVFIPVLFMGGILGRLLEEFAVTLAIAILISGVVALTLTPMLASRAVRQRRGQASGRIFAWVSRGYERALDAVLAHRILTMVVAAAGVVGTAILLYVIPKGLFPAEDTGQIFALTRAAQGTSFEAMVAYQKRVTAVISADPSVDALMSAVGASGPSGATNAGRVFVRLKPRGQRSLSADEVIAELRPKLAAIPGVQSFLQNPPPIRLGGQLTRAQYQVAVQSANVSDLYAAATGFEAKLRGVRGLQDVSSDLELSNPELQISIDRDQASALGLTAQRIEDALFSAYASRQISTIFAPTNQYWVILELADRWRRDPAALSLLHVRSATGRMVPLDAVTTRTFGAGPLSVNHLGQLPAVTISFNLAPGASLGEAVARVQQLARETLPEGTATSFQGTAQAFQSSFRGLGMLVVLAVVIIYVVLGILYESFIHPLTILSGLPSAGFGALLLLLVTGHELDIYSFVGILLLVGIVKKNAIMMIDFALEAERSGGKSPTEAIREGCLIRFRPIMMTTTAALMGAAPIALGLGAGAEARRPLGIAVVGGLAVSQLLTLFITPVVYTYLDSFQSWIGRRVRRARRE